MAGAAARRAAAYYELSKPKIWYLLVFTALGGAVVASSVHPGSAPGPATWALMLLSVAAGSAAANVLTNYHDRDIDAVMERTRGRPIPSGRIPAGSALRFGLALAAASLAMAAAIGATEGPEQGAWAAGLIAFGLANNVLVYSYALKRRSRSNILLGGLCGGAPPLIGWASVTTADMWGLGLVMAGLVFVWIPMHIWALVLHFREDYARVGVPMLTAVSSVAASARFIAASTVAMAAFSAAPAMMELEGGGPAAGPVYLASAAASGALMVALSAWVVARPTERAAWVLFKFSSPYLAVLFLALMADAAL